jgi:glycosyltransferase involved in cell wall biosynthesis
MVSQIPKVSIIIPNYNHSNYLPKRIESVLNQTFTDFEVLILDDCSQDNSQEIIEQYVRFDSRVTAIANKQNSGSVFKQWKLGINSTKGNYVWIAESDDFAEATFLEKLVALLDQDSTIAFAYSNSWIVDEKNSIQGTTADWKQRHFDDGHWDKSYLVDGKQELQHYLAMACTVNNASSVLFRRSSIAAAGGVDSNFRYTGDWLLYIKLSLKGAIAYTPECLSNYREHSANASKKSVADGSQLFERLKCFAYLYKSDSLPTTVKQKVMSQASKEYSKLQYDLLRINYNPKLLFKYAIGIFNMSSLFYFRLQFMSSKLLINK